MGLITYPLNNVKYRAEDAEMFHAARESGVFGPSEFIATANGANNDIAIGKGLAWISNGQFSGKAVGMRMDDTVKLDIAPLSEVRYDYIVLQFLKEKNATELTVIKGKEGDAPKQIVFEQTENVFQLPLYMVKREPAALFISQENITDLKGSDLCPYMYDGISKVDNTLSVLGYSAEAKATGEKIKEVSDAANTRLLELEDFTTLTDGKINEHVNSMVTSAEMWLTPSNAPHGIMVDADNRDIKIVKNTETEEISNIHVPKVFNETGTSETDTMSQKAITDAIGKVDIPLPIASKSTLGGVKIGKGVNVTADGTISVIGGSGSPVEIVQETGTSTTAVMSQNAITETLNTVQQNFLSNGIPHISEVLTVDTSSIDQDNAGRWNIFVITNANDTKVGVATGRCKIGASGTISVPFEIMQTLDQKIIPVSFLTDASDVASALAVKDIDSYNNEIKVSTDKVYNDSYYANVLIIAEYDKVRNDFIKYGAFLADEVIDGVGNLFYSINERKDAEEYILNLKGSFVELPKKVDINELVKQSGYSNKPTIFSNRISPIPNIKLGGTKTEPSPIYYYIQNHPIEAIPDGLFEFGNLSKVKIPDGLKTIGARAFKDNKFTDIDFIKGVTTIGESAFENNLITSVEIPYGVVTIEKNTFNNNMLESVSIPSSVKTIAAGAFTNNKLTSVSIPEGTVCEDGAFDEGVIMDRW